MRESPNSDSEKITSHLQIATEENVRVGDLAQFPTLFEKAPFLPIVRIGNNHISSSSYASRSLSLSIVITQDIPPRVLFGAELLQQIKEERVEQEIERIRESLRPIGTLGETPGTQPYLEELREDIRRRIVI